MAPKASKTGPHLALPPWSSPVPGPDSTPDLYLPSSLPACPKFLFVSIGVRWSPCSLGAWCFQLGETHRPPRQVLLCGPQYPDHHVAAPHGRVRAELWAVAVPTQPAPGRHAALQPKVPLPGETCGPAARWRCETGSLTHSPSTCSVE